MTYANYEHHDDATIERMALDLRGRGIREVAVIRGVTRGNVWTNKTYHLFTRLGWWKTGEELTKDGDEYIVMKTR